MPAPGPDIQALFWAGPGRAVCQAWFCCGLVAEEEDEDEEVAAAAAEAVLALNDGPDEPESRHCRLECVHALCIHAKGSLCSEPTPSWYRAALFTDALFCIPVPSFRHKAKHFVLNGRRSVGQVQPSPLAAYWNGPNSRGCSETHVAMPTGSPT